MASWPPPARVFGPDLHRSAFGTYIRQVYSNGEPFEAVYSPRSDDDYRRLERNFVESLNRRLESESE
jgi:hypothetical protein